MQQRLADGRIKLRHLQCFLAVMQLGSLQQAAGSLSISQPAVSKTLAELEDILGTSLFARGRGGAQPTREALWFAPHAQACVNALREGVSLLSRSADGDRGFVTVGMLPTVAAALAPALLARLLPRWPGVSLRLVTGTNRELLAQLRAGDLDIAMSRVSDPEHMTGLSFEHLVGDPLAVVVRAGHPLCAGRRDAMAHMGDYPVLIPPEGTMIRQAADRLLATGEMAPLGARVELLSMSASRALALDNDAIWIVPDSAVRRDIAAGTLARLPVSTAGTEEPLGVALRKNLPPSPIVQAVLEILRDVAPDTVGALSRP
jgi:LysR family pca operon transcriptional activator